MCFYLFIYFKHVARWKFDVKTVYGIWDSEINASEVFRFLEYDKF